MQPAPGTTLAGRYRVARRAWDSPAGPVWLARDEVLEREVLIQTFSDESGGGVARAVARTAQIAHPGLAQIYDVCSEPLGIVFENAAGGRLVDRRALPLHHAAAAALQLANALSALHAHGVAHGAVGPDTVLFDEEGRPKLAGAGLAVELDDGDARAPDAYRPDGDAAPEERDRYGLAAVAYRLFTGRDPTPDAPPARAARKGVPPQVDALLARGLAREAAERPTLEDFRRVLEPFASAEPPERAPGFFRQEARWLVPVLVLVGAAIAVAIGVQSNVFKIGGGEETPQPSPSVTTLAVADVRDFDPEGDGEEHARDADQAADGTDKGWFTVGYKTANLGGLKKGVGLVFDLGAERAVARIEVRTSLPGWVAEWRVADADGRAVADFTKVADFTAGASPVLLPSSARGRYWLLWITRLVDNQSGSRDVPFQAQVGEVLFVPR
jgi:serine/threonine protein kinase